MRALTRFFLTRPVQEDSMSRPISKSRFARWQYLRWVLALAVLPALWSCVSHTLEQPIPDPTQQTEIYHEANPNRDVDILFMIDNSNSMKEEQDALRANFHLFIEKLRSVINPLTNMPELPNVRIGIVSSDMGGCPGQMFGGDGANFKVLPGCGLNDGDRWIQAYNNETATNFPGKDLSDVFSCMANLGVAGCGYEHQLMSTVLALDPVPELNPYNVGFLARKTAYLAIILITDEDDCSALLNTTIFEGDIPGQTNSLRCATKGHLCGGMSPPADNFTSDFTANLSECESNEAGELYAVSDLVAAVKKVKAPRPDRIFVSAITGVPEPTEKYRIGKNSDGDYDYLPACDIPGTGKAAPAIRVKKFVDAFAPNNSIDSLCGGAQAISKALQKIGDKLFELLSSTCIDAPLADKDSDQTNGVQADCHVSDRRPSPSCTGFLDTPLPQCDAGLEPRPCWRLVTKTDDPTVDCPASNTKYEVKRPGDGPAPLNTQEVVKCLTCAKKNDQQCWNAP